MESPVTRRKTMLADAGLVYAAAIWGSTFVIVKESLAYIHPVILVGYRFLLAALLLGILVRLKRQPLLADFKPGFYLGLLIWVLYITQTIGLKYTTASNSAFITGLFVAFLPLLTLVFLRRLPSGIKLLAIVISLAGLWLLTGGIAGINDGDLITLLTAVAYAAHILMADRYVKSGLNPYVLSFQQFLVVGVLSLVTGLVFQLPFAMARVETLWVVVFLALFPTLSAFLIQMVAQRFTTAVKVSLVFALEPVFAALFAWTIGGEEFLLRRALGGLLIFAAMILSGLENRRLVKRRF